MKVVFTMTPHENKPKHSTRFEFEALCGDAHTTLDIGDKFKPSFYLPKPLAEHAQRIRVTIEVIN
jgi:hypothetical protein